MKQFSKINIQKQTRRKIPQNRYNTHYGLDTETLNGKLYLLTYSGENKTGYLYNPIDNKQSDIENILQFLTEKKFRNSLNWFYNLDYDVRAILKHIPENNISELYHNKQTKIGDYTLMFLSKKFFTIRKNKQTYNYYDVSQFFPGSLDNASEIYLNNKKISTINPITLGSSIKYWKDNLSEIIKYCIQDSFLTGQLGKLFYTNLWNTLKFNPQKPYSAGSISQEFFINNSNYIPTTYNIPPHILEIHQNNYRGGRIEILKRGFFNNLQSYDLKSAYPSEMINLYDYSAGNWIKSTNFDEKYHGIYKVKFNWFHENIGFMAFNSDYKTIYPNTENCVSWMNEKELCILNNNPKYTDYEIIKGFTFHPYHETFPYRDLILKLFNLKESANNPNERMIYKLYINSIYGKTAQAIYDKKTKMFNTGKLYNPIYANRITTNTRVSLLKEALKISKKIAGFSTDSIQTTGTKIKTGKKLGDFTHEYTARESVILMAGIRYTDKLQKLRGFTKKDETGKELILRDILKEHPNKTHIPLKISKPITIFQGLNYKKYTVEDINIFKTEERILNINGDSRRIWFDDFINADDIYNKIIDSTPIFIEDENNP